jgi:hypothetical protein
MDDFDDLLAGLDALDDFLAQRLGFDLLNEIAGDLEIDVRVQQGHTDLAQGVADVAFGDFAQAAQVAEGILEFLRQSVEHGDNLKFKLPSAKSKEATRWGW